MTLTQVTTGGVDENINIDSNTLKVDGTNNRVGIGTNSPANILHLSSTGTPTIQITDEDNSGIVKIENGSGSLFLNADTGNTVSNSRIQFGIDGSERLRIDSSGRVGIGLTPHTGSGYALQIDGGSTSFLQFFNDTTGETINDGLVIGNDSSTAYIVNKEATPLVFRTSNTERMRIDSSGNVGIGDTSPVAPLHVRRNSSATSGIVRGLTLKNGNATNSNRLALTFASINNFDIAAVNGVIESHAGQATNAAGRLEFYTNASGDSSPTERMRIDSSGQVILNNSAGSSDATVLRITGGTSGSSVIEMGDTADTDIGQIAYYHSSNEMAFRVNASERMRIDSSGRLLVGVSSAPSGTVGNDSHLSIKGTSTNANGAIGLYRNTASPSAGQGIGAIYFANSDGYAGAYIQGQSDGTWGTNDYPGRLVFFTTADGASSATERMRIASTGGLFVGQLGVTSNSGNPDNGIHVNGYGTHIGNTHIGIGDSAASARWRISTGSYNLNFLQNNGSGSYIDRARINNSTGTYTAVSDRRVKKNITNSSYGIDELKQLRPVSYYMNDQDENTDRLNLGFIAQEVLSVIPEAVSVPEDPEEMHGLESSALIPVLVSSLQEAVAKIEILETKVAALEAAG